MFMRFLRAGLPGLVVALVPVGEGVAHEIVGNRFFRRRLKSTIPASTTNCPSPPSRLSRPATILPSGNAISRGVLKAHYRGVRSFVRRHAQPSQRAKRADRDGSGRISKSGDDLQIPPVQGPGARVRHVGRPQRRMGQDRRATRGRGTVQHLHADPVFRQRVRRSSGHTVVDTAGSRHRSGRLRDPGQKFDHDLWESTPTAGIQP